MRIALAFGLCVGSGGLLAPVAHAYCRTRTCSGDLAECKRDAQGCLKGGHALFYASPCLYFGTAKGQASKLGLSDQAFSDIVEEAFERWQLVDCGAGKTPGVFVQNAGPVKAQGEFSCDEPSLNMGVWLFQRDWRYNRNAVGNTGPVFDTNTGEVFDADVALNLDRLEELPSSELAETVLAIATHEAGHVLGLDHSDVASSVMYSQYVGVSLKVREFAADDVAGICAIYPPDALPKTCPKVGVSDAALNPKACEQALSKLADTETGGCSVSARTQRSGTSWTLFAGALVCALLRGPANRAFRGRRRLGSKTPLPRFPQRRVDRDHRA